MAILRAIITFILAGALLLLAVAIAVENSETATLRLWLVDGQITLPLSLVIIGSFALGLVLGAIAMLPPLLAGKWRQRGLKATIRKMEKREAEAMSMAAEESPPPAAALPEKD